MKKIKTKRMNVKNWVIIGFFMTVFITQLSSQCPKIVWSDEFDGTTLDAAKWSYQIGDGCDINLCQWGNNELQWYLQENVQVAGGTLKITAKRETVQNRNYTSGRIRTRNKGDIKYGRIEARMKMPIGKGIWPAFWMLPTDEVYGIWPQSGELDIMEYLGHTPSVVHGTLHYGNPWPNNSNTTKSFTLSSGGFNDGYHIYALEWTENDIKWYVDGYLYSTKTRSDLGSSRWPFDQKFHFLFNMAVGGNWPGNPDGSTVFPQVFEVDYVRVYDLVGAPYLTGNQKVPFMAKNSTYSISNMPANSTVVWSVPASATIVSGAGTKDLTVNWGSVGGKISATVTSTCGDSKFELAVQVEPNFTTAIVLENFDKDAKIIRTSSTGTFTDNVANPASNTVNSSALCGKYVRNGSQLFDVLFYDVADIQDGSEFTSGEKKFYIDLNTNAPIGTTIILQLENKNQAQASNYPTGRHSRFTATTTKQNEWERLNFVFTDKPDASTSNFSINQMVLLFASNTNTSATYYFDNFEIYAKNTTPTVDIQKQYNLRISPNPATNILLVEAQKDKMIGSIEITNAIGEKVLIQNNINNSEARLPIHNLTEGVYFLSVLFKDATFITKKFVKK
jgi:beta-glucanase (GH16 family)